jgi:hypothetical protein
LGENVDIIATLVSKKAGVNTEFGENCMILKAILIGKRPFIRV